MRQHVRELLGAAPEPSELSSPEAFAVSKPKHVSGMNAPDVRTATAVKPGQSQQVYIVIAISVIAIAVLAALLLS